MQAIELKKLQTPLYEEFLNSLNPLYSPTLTEVTVDENTPRFLKLPPKSRSPSRTPSSVVDVVAEASPGSCGRRGSHIGVASNEDHQQNPSPQTNDRNGIVGDAPQTDQSSPKLVHMLPLLCFLCFCVLINHLLHLHDLKNVI